MKNPMLAIGLAVVMALSVSALQAQSTDKDSQTFIRGTPGQSKLDGKAPSPAYVSNFLATSDGLALTKAFMRIKDAKLRRSIVRTVEMIAGNN